MPWKNWRQRFGCTCCCRGSGAGACLGLRSNYVFIFTATAVLGAYGWWVFGVVGVEHFTGPDALVRIGRAIVVLIVAGYAFERLVMFLVVRFNLKVRGQTTNDLAVDERDKQIVYKSLRNSHAVLCGGLFLSVGALAFGWSAFWVFHAIVLAFLLSVAAELATKLSRWLQAYWRGLG